MLSLIINILSAQKTRRLFSPSSSLQYTIFNCDRIGGHLQAKANRFYSVCVCVIFIFTYLLPFYCRRMSMCTYIVKFFADGLCAVFSCTSLALVWFLYYMYVEYMYKEDCGKTFYGLLKC